jgi:hypothetical protein
MSYIKLILAHLIFVTNEDIVNVGLGGLTLRTDLHACIQTMNHHINYDGQRGATTPNSAALNHNTRPDT